MAESKEAADAHSSTEPSPSKLPLIAPLLNAVVLLGALGFMAYAKLVFKKAPITETGERERLSALQEASQAPTTQALIPFEPMTINIAPSPVQPQSADGTTQQLKGKLHYATIGFTLQIRDEGQKDFITTATPMILDRMILILGKKRYHELTTIQGRYVLHSQFLDQINQLLGPLMSPPSKERIITDIFFTQFIVQ